MAEPTSAPGGRGCLTSAEIAALQSAAPGKAPEGVARHLASCSRCQEKLLFGGALRPGSRKPAPEPPTLRRALLLTALVLGAMLVFFWTLYQLAGRIE